MQIRLFILFCLSCMCVRSYSQSVTAANRFISTLTAKQKDSTVFSFGDEERYNFHFVPKPRRGITFNEMNAAQRNAAIALVKTGLSEKGFQHAHDIMQLDQVLKIMEKRKEDDHFRDTGNYHISIFGIPSPQTQWGWRLEGHHISFNFSYDKNHMVSGTPGFLGSNPAIVPDGPHKGKQVLKEETDLGYALVQSLSEEQLTKALLSETAPADIISFNKRNATPEDTKGIDFFQLQPPQQEMMLKLIREYVGRYTKLFADDMLREIQDAGLQGLSFAWAGSREKGPGQKHYYRITGPTLVIEYDNTQNNGNHVHSVIRDLKHDFGGDLLLEHYQKEHNR